MGYLLASLGIGIVVALVTGNLNNMVEEREFRESVRMQIESTIASFKEAVPKASAGQVISFLKQYIGSAMQGKVIIANSPGKYPDNKGFRYLFAFSEEGQELDIYIKNSYVRAEVDGPDAPDFFAGLSATVAAFTAIIVYSEKKRQSLLMQQHFENRNAELKKALEEHEALALLGRMAATLAHELKTPLGTISNLIHVLPSRRSDEHFMSRFNVLIKEELDRTRQLVDNLLVYGKDITIENCQWVRLGDFVSGLSEKMGLGLAACPDADIYTDEFYIRLLLENLLRNSAQAGSDAISLKIGPHQKNDAFATLLYEDNGSGFPKDCDLDSLFVPFNTGRSRGTGLGLFLAQKIALAHGGGISLYRLQKGAGIVVTLPGERFRFNG